MKTDNDVLIEFLIDESEDIELIQTIEKAAIATLCEEGIEGVELSISVVNETEIKQLNKKSRNIDQVTDVLSFPFIDFAAGENIENCIKKVHMLNPETQKLMLGDIIICLPVARRQAAEYNHSIQREMAFLAVHGALHLLGYDHVEKTDEEQMCQKQENILAKCSIHR